MVPEIRAIFINKMNRCGQDLKQVQANWDIGGIVDT
jgi:hypothetical protein